MFYKITIRREKQNGLFFRPIGIFFDDRIVGTLRNGETKDFVAKNEMVTLTVGYQRNYRGAFTNLMRKNGTFQSDPVAISSDFAHSKLYEIQCPDNNMVIPIFGIALIVGVQFLDSYGLFPSFLRKWQLRHHAYITGAVILILLLFLVFKRRRPFTINALTKDMEEPKEGQ